MLERWRERRERRRRRIAAYDSLLDVSERLRDELRDRDAELDRLRAREAELRAREMELRVRLENETRDPAD